MRDPHLPANYYMDGTPIFNEYPTTHLDMLGGMDKAVGSLVSMIENKGLANDTIIIFTSDNGGLKGRSAESVAPCEVPKLLFGREVTEFHLLSTGTMGCCQLKKREGRLSV